MVLESFKVNGNTVEIDYCPDTDSPHEADGLVQLVLWGGRNYTFPNDMRVPLRDLLEQGGMAELNNELAKRHGALMLTPVWVYEHSGIALKAGARTYPFDDRWDSAAVGFAFITQASYQRCMGRKYTGHASQYAKAQQAIETEVELYGQYVNGETYGYRVVGSDGIEIDQCGGFVGWDAVKEAATGAAS